MNILEKSCFLALLFLIYGSSGWHAAKSFQQPVQSSVAVERLLADADQLALKYRRESSLAALSKYQEALRRLERTDDRIGVVHIMTRIANVYRKLGDSKQWIKYSEIASSTA